MKLNRFAQFLSEFEQTQGLTVSFDPKTARLDRRTLIPPDYRLKSRDSGGREPLLHCRTRFRPDR
jgi:hypothetical protein